MQTRKISFLLILIFFKAFDLYNSLKRATFAYQNEKIMNTLMNTFSRFERLVTSLAVVGELDIDFHQVCRLLRVSPYTMEEILTDQLGMTGEEILDIYRS